MNKYTLCTCLYYGFFSFQILVIVDAKPKALRLPTDAYYAVEEVHDVSRFIVHCVSDIWGHLCCMKVWKVYLKLWQTKQLAVFSTEQLSVATMLNQ